jgi:arsenate reductase
LTPGTAKFSGLTDFTVYEKPTCSTCRELVQILEGHGIAFERIDYHVFPLPAERIRELLDMAGIRPRDALRTKEPIYAELGLDERDVTDGELIDLMAEHPQLLQRPIVVRGDRAVLARPASRVMELFE